MLQGKKVVLAYSGGLDTSVCVKWLEEQGAVPYALYVDLGQGEPADDVKAKALRIGAADAFVRDAKAEFADEYVAPAIKANALYGGKYPLFTALARPLIAKKLVEAAREVGATHIAHGSTGKGNDQVRFDVTTASIAPDLTVVAPGARLEHEPPRGDGLRRGARYPRPDHERVPLQRGREPLGPLHRGWSTRRPRPRAYGRRVRADYIPRERPRRAAVRRDRLRRRPPHDPRRGRAAAGGSHSRTRYHRRRATASAA